MREKFEEEEKKKKVEEEDDSKFDYLTLLVNTTKKYGNVRKGASGGVLTFKHSMTKKGLTNGSSK
jgi:hypothetical protein